MLQSIGLLLSEPNPDDSLMADIVRAARPRASRAPRSRLRVVFVSPLTQASEFKHQRGVFEEKARRWTQQHACGTLAAQAGGGDDSAEAAGAAEAAAAGAEAAAPHKRAAEGEAGSDTPAEDAKPAQADAPPQRKRLQLSRPAPPPPPAD